MSKTTPENWADTREWSDITEAIKSACDIINSIEDTDFTLVQDGKQRKKYILDDCLTVIERGLQAILTPSL